MTAPVFAPSSPTGPDRLGRIAYVFSGFARVLAFYGDLDDSVRSPSGLSSFVACCSQLRRAADDRTEAALRLALSECGWTLIKETSHRERWIRGSFVLELLIERSADTGSSLHVFLRYGDCQSYVSEYLDRDVVRHRAMRASAADAGDRAFWNTAVAAGVSSISGKRLAVYTGAGVSVASGIPTFFGASSLDEQIRLQEPFPGDAVAQMIAAPGVLATTLAEFQKRLRIARPNRAHRLIADLRRRGVVQYLVTSNIDSLHEQAGDGEVYAAAEFRRKLEAGGAADAEALLVTGVSDDDYGIVAAWRRSGRVVAVADPEQPPFLWKADVFIRSSAESVLEALMQGTKPLAGRRALRALPSRFGALVRHIEKGSACADSEVHGRRHWLETASLGLDLLRATPEADPVVVLLFALFHDACRRSDGDDRDHGKRAAALAGRILPRFVSLSTLQRRLLSTACACHADGHVSNDATIGLCWDADRLGLWRIGVQPDVGMLSLRASCTEDMVYGARAVKTRALDWKELAQQYATL